jgi:hypothetical protein
VLIDDAPLGLGEYLMGEELPLSTSSARSRSFFASATTPSSSEHALRAPKNRHLVDVRRIDALPPFETRDGLRIAAPLELVVMKVISLAARRARPKGATDLADVRRLLIAFPELQRSSAVGARLVAMGAGPPALAMWEELASTPIEPDDADE